MPRERLPQTAALFALAIGLFVVASLTHRVWPLFVAWAPLVAVPWLLTRPPGALPPEQAGTQDHLDEQAVTADGSTAADESSAAADADPVEGKAEPDGPAGPGSVGDPGGAGS